MTDKKCSICNVVKSPKGFYYNKKRDRYEIQCKECVRAKKRKKYAEDPEWKKAVLKRTSEHHKKNPEQRKKSSRDGDLRRNYGITQDDYDLMLKEQNHRCKICRTDIITRKYFSVDHCHQTGKVRGLLCQHCNQMLGHAKDSVDTLQNAIDYLEESRGD